MSRSRQLSQGNCAACVPGSRNRIRTMATALLGDPSVSGLAALAPPDPAHVDSIVRSHERCAALGLSRIERPDHAAVLRADLTIARERNRRLHEHAAPVMELLLEQIIATQSMIVLTDAQGTVLHSVGHDHFLQRASKVAL